MSRPAELAVIIPVYNEEGAIRAVLEKWLAQLNGLGMEFALHVYNDGSRDDTGKILDDHFASQPRVVIHHKANSGHGPTILQGYRENSSVPWLFQTDSDDEISPEQFPQLWSRRESADLLLGYREGRHSGPARAAISVVARLVVRALYGAGVRDINEPFRLMRSERFQGLFESLPADTFAPNVLVSAHACWRGLRIAQVPVAHHNRRTGEVSIRKWKLFKAAARSFWQTVRFRFVARFL